MEWCSAVIAKWKGVFIAVIESEKECSIIAAIAKWNRVFIAVMARRMTYRRDCEWLTRFEWLS